MPRKKNKLPSAQANSANSNLKIGSFKKSFGYWFTIIFAVIAALSLIISLILPALYR